MKLGEITVRDVMIDDKHQEYADQERSIRSAAEGVPYDFSETDRTPDGDYHRR